MRTSSRFRVRILLLSMVIATTLSIPTRASEPALEYRGTVVDTKGALPNRTSTQLRLRVDSTTPPEEVAELARLLAEQGPRALTQRLEKIDRGWIQLGSRTSYPVSFARIFDTDEGRLVRVLTHRPIAMAEAFGSWRTTDYPYTILELQIGEDGKGEGRMIAGARLRFVDGELEVTSYGIEPFRVVNVRQFEKKAKKK